MALTQSLNGPMTDPIRVLGGVLREPSVQKRGERARQLTEPLMRAESQARTDFEKAKAEATKGQITAEKSVQDQFVTGLGTAQTAYEGELGQQPERTITAFNPERATELAVLTAIMGAFAGGISGRAGLSAMKGVSEGYRTGQEDLYKREVDNYEAALGQYKQKIAEAKQIYDNAVKLETEKRGAGLIEIKKLDPLLQDSVITAHVRAQDLKGVGESLREAMKLADQLEQKKVEAGFPRASSQQMRLTTVKGEDGKSYIVDAFQFVPGTNPAIGVRGVIGEAPARAAEAGVRERTFALRTFTALVGVTQDIENILKSPATARMPALAGIIASDPNTILGSLIALGARTLTTEDERAFQQISEQIAASLARIEAQGLASGTTLANVRSFDALRPKAGDSALNMALYLARLKQELEVGVQVFETNTGANEEQKRIARTLVARIDDLIPFDPEDVMKRVPGAESNLSNEMKSLVRQPNVFLTIQEPQQGQTQQPQQGKTATMGNVRATAKARGITVEDAKELYRNRGYRIIAPVVPETPPVGE